MESAHVRMVPVVLAALLLSSALTACGSDTFTATSEGMRVYQETLRSSGEIWTCDAFTLPDHVRGTLRVTPGADDVVWVKADDGQHLFIAWPDDFTLQPDPVGAVLDQNGDLLAEDGDLIELTQMSPDSADGTAGDPYLAGACDFMN